MKGKSFVLSTVLAWWRIAARRRRIGWYKGRSACRRHVVQSHRWCHGLIVFLVSVQVSQVLTLERGTKRSVGGFVVSWCEARAHVVQSRVVGESGCWSHFSSFEWWVPHRVQGIGGVLNSLWGFVLGVKYRGKCVVSRSVRHGPQSGVFPRSAHMCVA